MKLTPQQIVCVILDIAVVVFTVTTWIRYPNYTILYPLFYGLAALPITLNTVSSFRQKSSLRISIPAIALSGVNLVWMPITIVLFMVVLALPCVDDEDDNQCQDDLKQTDLMILLWSTFAVQIGSLAVAIMETKRIYRELAFQPLQQEEPKDKSWEQSFY